MHKKLMLSDKKTLFQNLTCTDFFFLVAYNGKSKAQWYLGFNEMW